ncbi:unnamed protein product [Prorocentrum cordatum]|uniref:Uncharacterized protein n=1 Tax=Prorocentrum cordatum TaxID=2364126 RepID=A0ABN9PPJ5_9DINO|nr:unnamed protein product [Polarella glacialis]
MSFLNCHSGQPEQQQEEEPVLGAASAAGELQQPLTGPEEAAPCQADEGVPGGAAQAVSVEEPEPAAPAHFGGSDAEDAAADKAAKGCCVPRAGRRRARGTRAAKADAAVKTTLELAPAAEQEVTPEVASSEHDEQAASLAAGAVEAEGILEAKQQGAGAGQGVKSRASAGA